MNICGVNINLIHYYRWACLFNFKFWFYWFSERAFYFFFSNIFMQLVLDLICNILFEFGVWPNDGKLIEWSSYFWFLFWAFAIIISVLAIIIISNKQQTTKTKTALSLSLSRYIFVNLSIDSADEVWRILMRISYLILWMTILLLWDLRAFLIIVNLVLNV